MRQSTRNAVDRWTSSIRGTDTDQGGLVSYASMEQRIPPHPLRPIRTVRDEALSSRTAGVAPIARFMSIIKLKTKYLDLLQGNRGTERYEDYPVYYRTNTVRQIRRHARLVRVIRTYLFGPAGNVASYAPRPLQPMVRAVDSLTHRLLGQSINIAIRAER